MEAFLIIAIGTILVTRLYLALAGYPQVGGGNLHIAHALYGGALMMVALLVGWLFLGGAARAAAIVLGGIGFGLFLDEVGKFVTVDNDYFFGPSAEIMYVCVVAVLVVNRVLRAVRRPTRDECLANAAAIAAEGAVRGLAPGRRTAALRLIDLAAEDGADPDAVRGTRLLIEAADHRADRLAALRGSAARLIPPGLGSPRWVPVIGLLMAAGAALTVAMGVVRIADGGSVVGGAEITGGGERGDIAGVEFVADPMDLSTGFLFANAILTLALVIPALAGRRRARSGDAEPLWTLRALRLAAVLSTMLSAFVHFARDGFGALVPLAFGLFAMGVLSYRLSLRAQARPGEGQSTRARRAPADGLGYRNVSPRA